MDTSKYTTEVITSPKHPDFEGAYALYDQCFTIPAQKDSKDSMIEQLQNSGSIDEKHKYEWVVIKDNNTGKVVAGTIIDVLAGNKAEGVDGTIAGNYSFVAPEYRGHGMLQALIEEREKSVKAFVNTSLGKPTSYEPRLLSFSEENDPLLLTPNDILVEMRAGTDQCVKRSTFEGKHGYRQIDMRWIQPEITEGEGPSKVLSLCVRGAGEEAIPKVAVADHLTRLLNVWEIEGGINNTDLAPLRESLARPGDTIVLHPKGRYTQLGKVLTPDVIETLAADPAKRDVPLGELLPEIAKRFYGKDGLQQVRDMLPAVAEKAAATLRRGTDMQRSGGR